MWWTFLSRKFLVLALATTLLWFGKIDGNVWLYIALAYVGTNVVQKYIEGRNGNGNGGPKVTVNNQIGVAPGENP